MHHSRLLCFTTGLATLFLLAHCGGGGSNPVGSGGAASGGTTSAGGTRGGTGGTTSSGSTSSAAGTKAAGGTSSTSGSNPTGGSSPAGGTASTSSTKATGGTSSSAGNTSAGGTISTSSTMATGGTSSSAGTNSAGGTTSSTGGVTSSGGVASSGGTASTGGVKVDKSGVALAKPGDSVSTSRGYLNLGDMRLLNNRWGSDALACSSTVQKVYANSDGTIGYSFNRQTCGGKKAYPDYPEIEFGVAPFGANSPDLTSPAFSSTTLLPIQIKSLTSASVNIDTFASTYQNTTTYDTNFEFWITKENPITSSSPGVYAEIIVFLGWDGTRMTSTGWACDKSGSVTAGSAGYNLCHQKDGWGSGWRFFNFNLNNGPQNTFSGKADIKALLDWVMKNYSGFTTDMWLTRIEVGTEDDDTTSGSAKINNLTFEINGTSKSIELAK
jgi:hypothetical protein